MVEKGDMAPDFELPADDGSKVKLSSLRGQKVVLYFYPKDDTSGCTLQACDLRDQMPRIVEKNAVVLCVSPDPVSSHKKFKSKYALNFPLLADEDTKVSQAYGVWKETSMYGRTHVHGHRAQHVHHRRAGQDPGSVAQGEACGPREGRAGDADRLARVFQGCEPLPGVVSSSSRWILKMQRSWITVSPLARASLAS